MAKGNDNLLEAKQLIEQIEQAWAKHYQALKPNADLLKTMSESFNKIKVPSDYANALQKIEANNNRIATSQKRVEAQIEKNRLADIRLQQQREKAFDKFEAQAAKERASLEKATNTYHQIIDRVKVLTQEYNNLAAMRELGVKLTDDENRRLGFLTKTLTGYNKVIDTANVNVGKYQQRVGQYASGFNPLTNSIGRLTQELPNLGQSFQIFAMSIGNNIAAFKDAIDDIRAQNKVLQAEGKATESIFSQVSRSLFSWNTLLYAGIALFISYGDEIGDWVASLFDADAALKSLTESQDAFNKSRVEGQKSVVPEEETLKRYIRIAQDAALSDEERAIALKKLRAEYPFYLKALSDNEILSGKTAKAEAEITAALKAKGEAENANEQIIKNRQRLLELITAEAKAEKEIADARRNVQDLNRRADTALGNEERSALRGLAVSAQRTLNKLISQRVLNQKEINGLEKQNADNHERIVQLQKQSIGLEYELEKTTKERLKARKDIEAIDSKSLERGTRSLIDEINNQIQAIEELRRANTRNFKDYAEYTKLVDALKESLRLVTEPPKTDMAEASIKRRVQLYKEEEEALLRVKTESYAYIKSITDNFIAQSDFPSIAKFIGGTEANAEFERLLAGATNFKEKFAIIFQAVGDVAKDVFAYINQLGQQNFESALSRLEIQKEVAIKFAGESTAAREEIERQYDERRKQILRQQAQQQKELAIFNAIINTAQGVTAALAQGSYALAIVIGVLGAAQIALIASQPIPEFWKGTKNAPEGIAWTQERGREIIKDKDGNVKSFGSDKGRQLTKLDKGDQVLTAAETSRELLAFNNDLNAIMSNTGILPPIVNANPGHGATAKEIGREIKKAIDGLPLTVVNADEDGFSKALIRNNQRTNYLNKRISGKGDRV